MVIRHLISCLRNDLCADWVSYNREIQDPFRNMVRWVIFKKKERFFELLCSSVSSRLNDAWPSYCLRTLEFVKEENQSSTIHIMYFYIVLDRFSSICMFFYVILFYLKPFSWVCYTLMKSLSILAFWFLEWWETKTLERKITKVSVKWAAALD